MERNGFSTSAIRNRARRREYERKAKSAPSLFACCGAEFVLQEFGQPDYEAQKDFERNAYEEKKKALLEPLPTSLKTIRPFTRCMPI